MHMQSSLLSSLFIEKFKKKINSNQNDVVMVKFIVALQIVISLYHTPD
jgi:hypothetical protein